MTIGFAVLGSAVALFVVSEGLDATGVMTWAGQQLIARAGEHDGHGHRGYRFGDHWKLGLCMLALFFVAATFLVPAFWSF